MRAQQGMSAHEQPPSPSSAYLEPFAGQSGVACLTRARVEQFVGDQVTAVWIHGEAGTGRRLLARAFHEGTGACGPMVVLDCTSPFTAEHLGTCFREWTRTQWLTRPERWGLCGESVRAATLVLQELDSLRLAVQADLIPSVERFLASRGATTAGPHGVHLVVTSIAAPEGAARGGQVDAELARLLRRNTVAVPPLRERSADIPVLVEGFVREINRRLGLAVRSVSTGALFVLRHYFWPRNLDELRSVVEHAIVMAGDDVLLATHLPSEIREWAVHGDASSTRWEDGASAPHEPAGLRASADSLLG